MDWPPISQLILGADKKNPHICIYEDEEKGLLDIYYGFERLEVVSNKSDDPFFKMAAGRLHNAGVKVRALEEAFRVDRKTLQRWAKAMLCGDPETFEAVFAGRQRGRKLTLEVSAYVKTRWTLLREAGCRDFRKQLIQEIKSVFGISISGEALRPLLQKLRKEQSSSAAATLSADSSAALASPLLDGQDALPVGGEGSSSADEKRETPCVIDPLSPATTSSSDLRVDQGVALPPPPPPSLPPVRKESPVFPESPHGLTRWCDHAGVLIFSTLFLRMHKLVDPPEPILCQWLASFLLGAANVEQTKFLNWDDLSLCLGPLIRSRLHQRDHLARLAQAARVEALLGFNAQQLKAQTQSDLYFDPHTKHYTGEQNILKGWCASIRWADKAMHSDFVHTVTGQPLYFEITDNYADLRARALGVMKRTRALVGWPEEQVLSWVIDRGIFSHEIFEQILDTPNTHLVTWEKGYQAQAWPAEAKVQKMTLTKVRNSSDDLRIYHFDYLDEPWPKMSGMRRLRVRATNPSGKTIEVSILTDDLLRPAPEIIRLMFNRWLQENDFKYLDKHFGLNQIISYQSVPYEQLKGQLEDRQVKSGVYQALLQQRRQLEAKQARLLLDHQRARRREIKNQFRLKDLEERLAALKIATASDPDLQAQQQRLAEAAARAKSQHQQRQSKIDGISVEIEKLQGQIDTTTKEVSRLDQLIAEGKVRLNTQNKHIMDALKIVARNEFYRALQPFKRAYDNYRDDHDYFRQLTQASGVLELKDGKITIHLLPKVNYPPHLRRIVEGYLDQLNQKGTMMPDGSGRPLQFRLAKKSELQLSMTPGS